MLLALPVAAADSGADGNFEKRTSSHFVLYQDVDIDRTSGFRGSRRFEQQALAALEQAYDQLGLLVGLRPERPVTVVIYDPAIFDARFAGLFRFPAAGFYGDAIHIRGDTVVSDRLVSVLYHELVHAALGESAPSHAVPAWFNEGLSEWFEARALGKRGLNRGQFQALSRIASQGKLFSLEQLSRPSLGYMGPESARAAYLQSYAFFDYLARRHGEKKIPAVVGEYVRTGNIDRSFKRTYRDGLEKLQKRFAQDYGG
jgi:hypothetical protein